MTVDTASFLSAFWGGTPGCFRQFHDSDRNTPGRNHTCDLSQLPDTPQFGTFFIPNMGGHTDRDITTFTACYIDLDSGKGHSWPDSWHITPSIITHRDGNFHAYWLLQPGTVTDADTFRQTQKRLIARYNSDKPIHNPARVMRLPGTSHWKTGEALPGYEVHYFQPQLRYTLEELTAGLPMVQVQQGVAPSGGTDVFDNSELAQSYVISYLTSKAPIAVSGETGNDTSYQVAAAVRDYGVSEDVALELMTLHWNERNDPPWDARDLARLVTHAYRYAQNTAGNRLEPIRQIMAIMPDVEATDPVLQTACEIGDRIKSTAWSILQGMEGWDALTESNGYAELMQRCEIEPDNVIIYEMLKRSFWSAAKRATFNLRNENLNQYAEKDGFELMTEDYGRAWDASGAVTLADVIAGLRPDAWDAVAIRRVRDQLVGLAERYIMNHLKIHAQRETTCHVTDLYGSDYRIEMRSDSARVIRPFRPFRPEEPVASVRSDIVADYKQHFPQLDEVLEFIAASRVSQNRKRSYLWLHADSDWGKGFFAACLSKMGASVDSSMNEVKDMMQGKAVGKTEAHFRNCLALVLDEVKAVNSEFKQLQDELHVSSKHLLTTTVPLYTKIIMSAENIPSLVTTSGVEDQFANRISRIKASGSLASRKVFQTVGQAEYQRHARAYVCAQLNDMIAAYIAMGRNEAERKAEVVINDFWSRYNLGKQCGLLSDSIEDIAQSFKEWCMLRRTAGRGYQTSVAAYDKDKNLFVLTNSSKAFDEWLSDTMDRAEQATIRYKKTDVMGYLSQDGKGSGQYWSVPLQRKVRGILFEYTGPSEVLPSNVMPMVPR